MRERNARRVKKDNTMFENITLLKKELDEAVNKPYIWKLLDVAKEYKSSVEDFSLQKIENSLNYDSLTAEEKSSGTTKI